MKFYPEVSWFLRRLLTDKHNARIHVCFRHPALAAQTRNYSKSYYASSYISKLRHTVAHMLEMVHMRPVFFCFFFGVFSLSGFFVLQSQPTGYQDRGYFGPVLGVIRGIGWVKLGTKSMCGYLAARVRITCTFSTATMPGVQVFQ